MDLLVNYCINNGIDINIFVNQHLKMMNENYYFSIMLHNFRYHDGVKNFQNMKNETFESQLTAILNEVRR